MSAVNTISVDAPITSAEEAAAIFEAAAEQFYGFPSDGAMYCDDDIQFISFTEPDFPAAIMEDAFGYGEEPLNIEPLGPVKRSASMELGSEVQLSAKKCRVATRQSDPFCPGYELYSSEVNYDRKK